MNPIHLFCARRFARTSVLLALLTVLMLGLPTACSKKNDATPQVICKLSRYTYQPTGSPSTTTFTYNADGQLLSTVSGGYSETYTYDGNGYVTSLMSQNTNNGTTSTTGFEYTNGRLIKMTNKDAKSAVTGTLLFEYDGSGNVTRYVDQQVGGNTYTATYSGGKQTGYVIRTAQGSETQPYTFEDGLIKRYTSGNYQYVYSYDAQRRRIRSESFSAGKLTGYTESNYMDGFTPQRAVPTFKGVPSVIYSYDGEGIGLISKATTYTVDTAGPIKTSETTYTHIKNSSGFPTETTTVTRSYDSKGQETSTSFYKDSYQYTGC